MSLDLTNPFRRRPARLAALPRIVRLYILNAGIGFVLSAVFTAAVLTLNIANIGHLVTHVDGGLLAAVVFFVLNGIVFASVQTGIVVMTLGSDNGSGGRRAPRRPTPEPLPVRVTASEASRRGQAGARSGRT
ncbi:MAG: hypothetical protein AAGM84_10385 [Pseudomonadota bacterium]